MSTDMPVDMRMAMLGASAAHRRKALAEANHFEHRHARFPASARPSAMPISMSRVHARTQVKRLWLEFE